MDFDKKLKTKIILGIIYILLGITMWICTLSGIATNDMLSSLQTVLIIIGIVIIVRAIRLKKNPKLYERVMREGNDERNNMIYTKASRLTLITCIYISAAAVIVLGCLGLNEASQTVSYCMIGVCAVHYLYVLILRKKY